MPTCAEADAVWARVVRALAAGLLGSSAKISSNGHTHTHVSAARGGKLTETRVICVYVDPFWDVDEMRRVLLGLREHCGIREQLKFKTDAATLLDIYQGNEHGIPPSLFASPAGALTYEPLPFSRRPVCAHFGTARGCKFAGACRNVHASGSGGE